MNMLILNFVYKNISVETAKRCHGFRLAKTQTKNPSLTFVLGSILRQFLNLFPNPETKLS